MISNLARKDNAAYLRSNRFKAQPIQETEENLLSANFDSEQSDLMFYAW